MTPTRKNCAQAATVQKLGYGPDKRLAVTVSTRNIRPIAMRQ
jgi:hypothetical protein